MHLTHHRDTNDPDLDPDHWVAVQSPFKVLFRCLTIVFWYHQYFWKHIAFHAHIPGMRPLTIHIAVMYLILYGIAFGLSVFGWWREVLALWIVPHILASALIIYFFAYLTHKPHEVHERYRDTNIFWVRGKIVEPVVNWLYMFQNFHLIHHLFPRVPFYLYPKAFRSLKPVLEQRARPHLRIRFRALGSKRFASSELGLVEPRRLCTLARLEETSDDGRHHDPHHLPSGLLRCLRNGGEDIGGRHDQCGGRS